MTVMHAKKPSRCGSCRKVIHTGQLVTDLSSLAHVDCERPNEHRLERTTSAALAPVPEVTLVGPGTVRFHGHVAEGDVVDRGDGTYDFRGLMVCGPHTADGEHLVAADERSPMTNRPGGEAPANPGDALSLPADSSTARPQPIRNSSTERES